MDGARTASPGHSANAPTAAPAGATSDRGRADAVVAAWRAVNRAAGGAGEVSLDWLGPLPPPHTWPLDGDSLRFLARLVTELRPAQILEFGSGLSTRVMARVICDDDLGCGLVTLENDPLFAGLVRRSLESDGTSACVTVQLAPLALRHLAGLALPVYHFDPATLGALPPVSLALVDGPAALLGGRSGTLFQAMELVGPAAVILLDDADRKTETDVLRLWREHFGAAIEMRRVPGFANLAAIVVTADPVPTRGAWWLELPGDRTRRADDEGNRSTTPPSGPR